MTDSKEWCDGDWRWRSSSKLFAGAESGSPGRALEAGKRGSPGRPVQAGIRGKRLTIESQMLALIKCYAHRTIALGNIDLQLILHMKRSNQHSTVT